MDAEKPQRRDPREAKELDYARHRRSAAEYPHAWRRQLPRKKAHTQRAFRRNAAEILRSARTSGHAPAELDALQRRKVVPWPNPTLGEHVTRVLDNRVERVASKYFKHPYDSARHRQPFARFLAALTAGRQGQSVALAQRFDRILGAPPALTCGPLDVWWPEPSRIHAWLLAFFADEPGWQPRLQDWITELLPEP